MRFNIVVLGDGYLASEMDKYYSDVQKFLNTLQATPPYNELWLGLNVYRVNVMSTDSGAFDPNNCTDSLGNGTMDPNVPLHTYFDAQFCSVGPGGQRLHRLLTVTDSLAIATAQAQVPEVHLTIVIVNSNIYGGSGGQVAVCSTAPSSAQIAIHEIGHTAFHLTDEYEGDGTATGPGEPVEPNATRDVKATNKWSDMIAATTPLPSSCYADCPDCASPQNPPPPDTVGTYEGSNYSHCGVYRPFPTCYMRDLGMPVFCPVCARVIRQTLQPYLPASE